MTTYYAIRVLDVMGRQRHFFDSYPTAKLACQHAKQMKRDRPDFTVTVLVENAAPGQIGANWLHFRDIR